jgi:hypothetical protein
MNIQELQANDRWGDWVEAFAVMARDKSIHPVVGDDYVSLKPWRIEDVVEVYYSSEGEGDGDDWLLVGSLKDGRFFSLSAWCDYTGWG